MKDLGDKLNGMLSDRRMRMTQIMDGMKDRDDDDPFAEGNYIPRA